MDYMNRVDWDVFSYGSNVPDDECLFDTLGDTDSDVKSPLKTFCTMKLLPHTSTFILLGINLTS